MTAYPGFQKPASIETRILWHVNTLSRILDTEQGLTGIYRFFMFQVPCKRHIPNTIKNKYIQVYYLLRVEFPLHHLHEVFVWHGEGHIRLPAVRAFLQRAAAVLQINGWRKTAAGEGVKAEAEDGKSQTLLCISLLFEVIIWPLAPFSPRANGVLDSLLAARQSASHEPDSSVLVWRRRGWCVNSHLAENDTGKYRARHSSEQKYNHLTLKEVHAVILQIHHSLDPLSELLLRKCKRAKQESTGQRCKGKQPPPLSDMFHRQITHKDLLLSHEHVILFCAAAFLMSSIVFIILLYYHLRISFCGTIKIRPELILSP